jgi:hypothetical protein
LSNLLLASFQAGPNLRPSISPSAGSASITHASTSFYFLAPGCLLKPC